MADTVSITTPVDVTPVDQAVEEKKIMEEKNIAEQENVTSDSPKVVRERDGADNELAETVRQQAQRIQELEVSQDELTLSQQRIQDLEQSLMDARKIIHNREELLAALQWKPKEDYYTWKNPKINDKTVHDAQERKLKSLLEQMRVMEKLLAERDQVLNSMILSGSNNSLTQSTDSPFSSPLGIRGPTGSKGSPAQQPAWSRSPADSPAFQQGDMKSSKALNSSWWWFKGSSKSTASSLGQSTPIPVSPASSSGASSLTASRDSPVPVRSNNNSPAVVRVV